LAFFQTKSGKEIELADEFVKAITMDKEDDEVNLIEFDHHDRQHHDQPQDSIQQVLYNDIKVSIIYFKKLVNEIFL
jgi:hypothetical protein